MSHYPGIPLTLPSFIPEDKLKGLSGAPHHQRLWLCDVVVHMFNQDPYVKFCRSYCVMAVRHLFNPSCIWLSSGAPKPTRHMQVEGVVRESAESNDCSGCCMCHTLLAASAIANAAKTLHAYSSDHNIIPSVVSCPLLLLQTFDSLWHCLWCLWRRLC